MSDKQAKDETAKYQIYVDERKALVEGEQASADQFDKNIITLAAGALGISLVFLEKIAPEPNAKTLIFLYIAWAALVISLLATLSSLLTSQHAYRRQREILEDNFLPEPGKEGRGKINKWARRTQFLNWTSIIAFIVGAAMLALFSIQNFKPALRNHNANTTATIGGINEQWKIQPAIFI